MKSDQIRSDQIVSGKGKKGGLVFGCTIILPLPLFYSHIYQRSAAREKKERNKSHKTVYVFVRVYVCVYLFRSSHIVYQGTYLGSGRT